LADEKSLAILVLNTALIGNENHFSLTISVIENLSTTFINCRYPMAIKHQRLPTISNLQILLQTLAKRPSN
jgi:hypothetical protein